MPLTPGSAFISAFSPRLGGHPSVCITMPPTIIQPCAADVTETELLSRWGCSKSPKDKGRSCTLTEHKEPLCQWTQQKFLLKAKPKPQRQIQPYIPKHLPTCTQSTNALGRAFLETTWFLSICFLELSPPATSRCSSNIERASLVISHAYASSVIWDSTLQETVLHGPAGTREAWITIAVLAILVQGQSLCMGTETY